MDGRTLSGIRPLHAYGWIQWECGWVREVMYHCTCHRSMRTDLAVCVVYYTKVPCKSSSKQQEVCGNQDPPKPSFLPFSFSLHPT